MDVMKLSRSAMIAITVLRVVVGWHFLYEGVAKLTAASWSAAGYMKASRGPFAAFFHWIASQPQLLDKANLITSYGLTIIGVLLILGLFTRLAAIPLFINMVVAILTVKMKKVTGLDDFVELDEPVYALAFLWLFIAGPGWASLDHLLWTRVRRGGR